MHPFESTRRKVTNENLMHSNLDGGAAGSGRLVTRPCFGLEGQPDILHRVVRWRRQTTRSRVRTRSRQAEVSIDQEDLSSERHRRATPRARFCTDLSVRVDLQGSKPRRVAHGQN